MTAAARDALKVSLVQLREAFTPTSLMYQYVQNWIDDVSGANADANHAAELTTGVSAVSCLPEYVVASLPTAVGVNNKEYIVTDSTVATNAGTVVGGGSTRVLVRSNNANWIIV